ncbi:MAG TPA: phage holin family protein [Chthonomonadales bacterium]|nr:phage holin family protein [Chthonomonadales bacterium]
MEVASIVTRAIIPSSRLREAASGRSFRGRYNVGDARLHARAAAGSTQVKSWIVRWIGSAFALLIVSQLNLGIHLDLKGHPASAFIAVLIYGLAASIIRPLILIFAWPINCLTFGLLGFAINVLVFFVLGRGFITGFHVDNPASAFIGIMAMSILSSLLNLLLQDRGERGRAR